MNINIDYDRKPSCGETGAITYAKPSTAKTSNTGVYQLDISGIVMDDAAYKSQGMTMDEVMQEVGNKDVTTQKNYMIVMSNSMSPEDFKKLGEEGFPIGVTEVDKIVTVLDQIKGKLIAAGVDVKGYTDTLSSQDLENIAGNASSANAIARKLKEKDMPDTEENTKAIEKTLDKALKIEKLTENAKRYLIENNKEPSIDNIYKAQYSSSGQEDRQGKGYYKDSEAGHYAKKADTIQWEQLNEQIEKIAQESELPDKKMAVEEAKWLIEKGIPLTKENLKSVYDLKQLELPLKRNETIDLIINAMVSGKTPNQTNLVHQDDIIKTSVAIKNDVNKIVDGDIEELIEENRPITVQNLLQVHNRKTPKNPVAPKQETREIAQNHNTDRNEIKPNQKENIVDESLNHDTNKAQKDTTSTGIVIENETKSEHNKEIHISDNPNNIKMITAHRQLEEIRLKMTVEANYKLLKKGFSIQTADLQKLVEALQNIELDYNKIKYGEKGPLTISEKETLYATTRDKVEQLPNMPAVLLSKITPMSLETLNQIHKKGNILKQEYKEASKTYEALMTVPRSDLGDSYGKAFQSIENILEDMDIEINERNKKAIRILSYNQMEITDKNIIDVKEADLLLQSVIEKLTPARTLQLIRENINPLEMNIQELEKQLALLDVKDENKVDKYANFLQHLDHNKEIDQEEKEAYIGIYRLLRQIEKTDGAVIGSLVNQGGELSFKNLLTAVRTKKKETIDYQIDEKFQGVNPIQDNNRISEQINNYYRHTATKAAEHILDNVKQVEVVMADNKEKIQQVQKVEDYAVQSLLDMDMPITIDNLLAASALSNKSNDVFRRSKQLATEQSMLEEFTKNTNDMSEKLTSNQDMVKAYEGLHETISKSIDTAIQNGSTSVIDMKAISVLFKEITFVMDKAKEENYEIPIEINGENVAINLRVLRGKETVGKVVATMNTLAFGQVAAEFVVLEGTVKGYIVGENKEAIQSLEKIKGILEQDLSQKGQELKELQFISSNTLHTQTFMQHITNQDNPASTKELYQVAKSFITSIQQMKPIK